MDKVQLETLLKENPGAMTTSKNSSIMKESGQHLFESLDKNGTQRK